MQSLLFVTGSFKFKGIVQLGECANSQTRGDRQNVLKGKVQELYG